MMVNPAVPARIRRLINVESGLNDGIATPFVLVAIAGAATAEHAASTGPGAAVAELALGVLIGVAVGGAAAGWSRWPAAAAGWPRASPAPRCWRLALCSYATSVALHGNGFIAAFTGGLAFAAAGGPAARAGSLRRGDRRPGVAAGLADVRGGRGGAGAADLTWQTVAVCGAQPDGDPDAAGGGRAGRGPARPAAVLFIGWFGPRGLASVVFAPARAGRPGRARGRPAITVIAFTVLLSVLAHGAERRPAGQPLRPPAHPATRRRPPGRAGRDTRTTPHPPLPGRRPARRTEERPLMTTDQVLPGAGPQAHRKAGPDASRAGRSAATGGRRRRAGSRAAAPRPGAVMRPLADRPLGRFARPRRRLRAGLVQLLCALAGLGLACCCPGSPLTPRWRAPG